MCACFAPERSSAAFRLRHVSFDRLEISAENTADETATTIVNVNLRYRFNVELLHHQRFPIGDVDLAQGNFRITYPHLLQAWRQLSALTAAIRVKIDNRFSTGLLNAHWANF